MLRDHVQSNDPTFQYAVHGMALISLDGTFLKINPALHDLLEHPQHEFISTISPELDLAYREMFSDIQTFGESLQSQHRTNGKFMRQIELISGRKLHVTIHLTIIHNEHHDPNHYFAQFEDRSRLSDMEMKLNSSEIALLDMQNSYRQLLEKMPLAVLITKNGITQYVNPAALRLFNVKDESVALGISTDNVVDASYHHELQERRKGHYSGQSFETVTYLINCLDGQQKFVEGFTLFISYEGEPAAVGVFKDITDQKQREEHIMQSEKLTMAGQLAAGIAHEIRNPLTSINGFVKLMRTSTRCTDSYFEIIESELNRIELIVNELLVLSKPQGNHVSKPVNVLPVLEQVITLMKVQSALKDIEIKFIGPDDSLWIVGEINQLKQVFINLLKNSIDAMEVSGTIYVTADSSDQEVLLSVQDEGSGMTPEQIQRLGQPFFTTKETGTGLGFMITQNIIHNHGGSIQIESTPGQVTTFTVKLPRIHKPEDF
ncbi:ATP-binding protein [Paenibacillus sp.]|uniref:ATP-binding protein n=1 Tax=Paenibacillus sp. TaxID=58172 RepID=UPI00281C0ABE|nr:ATP-binding protein [Paenibacillus sp.]MDR0266535.1 PAS domain S-box protein [Paenibacillus sp.]